MSLELAAVSEEFLRHLANASRNGTYCGMYFTCDETAEKASALLRRMGELVDVVLDNTTEVG
jgi:hypothetical protein